MTEKDTKEDPKEVENEDDYYNENDNYYIDKALGNIKDDPGTHRSRPRRIPVYKIQLTDEEKIPPMPDKILKEPKDEEFQKKIDELREQNRKKQNSIKEYLEKIKQERMGVKSDDKGNLFQRKKDINIEIKKLTEEINIIEQEIIPIRNKFNLLSDKVKTYEKYHLPNHINKLNQEIKKIKEKISFAPVSVNEENELINRKNLLEEYQKALKAFIDFKKENNEALNKAREPKQKRKELYTERDKISKEIGELKAQKDVVIPEIENMKKIVDSLKEDKRKISEQIRELNNEWNNQWNEYTEQQNLIKYIKDAHARIKGLKKKVKKKQKEGEEKKEEKNKQNLEITSVKKTDRELKLQELQDLKNYFQNLMPKEVKVSEQEIKQIVNNDISKDIQSGKLKILKKNEEVVGVENAGKQKKKGKKPKEPKDSRKAAKKTGLILDFEMIQKITDAGLNPPTKLEDIPLFLKNLEKRQEGIKSGEINIEEKKEEPKKVEEKKEVKEIIEVKEEKVVKEEPKKEEKTEPVVEIKKVEEKKEIKKEEKKEEKKIKVVEAQKVKSIEVKKEDEEEEDEEEEEEEDDEEEVKKSNNAKQPTKAIETKTPNQKEAIKTKKK